jgi:hypothetical protein
VVAARKAIDFSRRRFRAATIGSGQSRAFFRSLSSLCMQIASVEDFFCILLGGVLGFLEQAFAVAGEDGLVDFGLGKNEAIF